jgi:predicted nucleic acid-binding protein
MLIDTDVIIWYMHGNPRAKETLDGLDSIAISVVTYMELMQGMRNKMEMAALEKKLEAWQCTIFPLNETISDTAAGLVKQFSLSHSMQLADALIAATALDSGLQLLTANDKHYKMIEGLQYSVFRPE